MGVLSILGYKTTDAEVKAAEQGHEPWNAISLKMLEAGPAEESRPIETSVLPSPLPVFLSLMP